MKSTFEEWPWVPFRVLREEWNRYDMGNGIIVRLRLILVAVRQAPSPKEKGPREFSSSFNILVGVDADPERRSSPNPNPKSLEELYKLELEEAEPVHTEESWNYYSIGKEGQKILKTQASMNSIHFAPGEYDQDGNPMLIVNSSYFIKPLKLKQVQSELRELGIVVTPDSSP